MATGGVRISASSSTTANVDLIQVYSKVYQNYQYLGFYINSDSNSSYVSILDYPSLYGIIEVSSQHDVVDWTGDEQTRSYDRIIGRKGIWN